MKIQVSGSFWILVTSVCIAACSSDRPSAIHGEIDLDLIPSNESNPANDPVATNDASDPEILSFSASAEAITQGDTVRLEWDIVGADRVTIEPDIGDVTSSSVSVSPIANASYKLTAHTQGKSATAVVEVAVLKGTSEWVVNESPPPMNNAELIDAALYQTSRIRPRSIHCGGLIRRITLSDNQDAAIYMSGDKPLSYPLHVTGGRNVRIVGLQFRLETQPGCGVGELPNAPVNSFPNANIHPRIPGAMALRLQQSGTSFIEGLNIDVMGHQADCIVSRNPDSLANDKAQTQRDVIIQNTVCRGVEGMGKTKIGDGVHGDLFQNQGNDILRRLVFENVSHRTSHEGIIIHGGGSKGLRGTKELLVRRYDYSWDPRYVGDDKFETFGLALAGIPGNDWTLEDVRIDDIRDGGDYMIINDQRYGAASTNAIVKHPEIRSGLPPEGAFALPERTGINYRSPHGGLPTR